jgi:hypothetical protein
MNQRIGPLEKWLLLVRKEDEFFTIDKFLKLRKFLIIKEKKDTNNAVSPKL